MLRSTVTYSQRPLWLSTETHRAVLRPSLHSNDIEFSEDGSARAALARFVAVVNLVMGQRSQSHKHVVELFWSSCEGKLTSVVLRLEMGVHIWIRKNISG